MTRDSNLTRRRFTALTATAALSTALAGCSGSGGDAANAAEADGDDATTAESTAEPTTESGETTGADSGSGGGSAPQFDGWFDNVGNYDGVVDETGSSTVTVTVGAQANGGAFGFGPAAIRVSPGTTVVWEWNGEGGSHNVAAADGSFESELAGSSGHTFEHTFEATGTYTYACTPHETLGMKGAVVVE
ncbi:MULTISPECIES: halocyanin domain-containing protein [Haloferax]|uniref:Plastocyanin n=1 Tax=Haloferax massiliensis TaxID=1476858 RepID=A0A0D6JL69_9EURY|nr:MULTISPECIES: halocyanin domain-containing protein [Haloferax]MDS0242778.1 halocyanin domain-containing protein [Haloferax sp. S2CR25]MDS0445899.1 halocyanin domain-containing protein [Haloferax sp. S2CR25-2]CQR48629.1 Plastocyanin precursor [Haloferax massiliensis]